MRSASRPQTTAAVLAALIVGALLPATASANHNDLWANRVNLPFNQVLSDTNNTAGAEAGPEVLTSSAHECSANGTVATDGSGRGMGGTLWWTFTGNGQPMTVTTKGSSDIDTVLGVWDTGFNNNQLAGCNDDAGNPATLAGRYSEVRVNTVNGNVYHVQVGGLCTAYAGGANGTCTAWDTGIPSIAAWTLPANDSRGGAAAIHDHHQVSFETRGAREDGGEITQCGTSPFGKTVWFRFDAPSKGRAHFTSSGFDTVMAIYDGSAPNFMDCHDDPDVSGPSHRAIEATPGHSYFVQVGGFGTGRAAAAGQVDMLVTWEQDTDWDDDKSAGTDYGGGDCQDQNDQVKPGIDDIVNNDVDDNCDDYKDYDRDGDRYRVTIPVRNPKPTNWDCNDTPGTGARIHPGARDVRGNNLNEDCKGGKAKALGLPSSITDNWSGKPNGAAVASMKVNPALKGSKIRISCAGSGCPFKSKKIPVRRRVKAFVLTGLFRGDVLKSGATLVVKVLPPSAEWIGRSETFRIQGSTVRSTKACWNVRGKKVRCP